MRTAYHYLTIQRARWVAERDAFTGGSAAVEKGEKFVPRGDTPSRYSGAGGGVWLASCSTAARKRVWREARSA
jgi:hypothetical protein